MWAWPVPGWWGGWLWWGRIIIIVGFKPSICLHWRSSRHCEAGLSIPVRPQLSGRLRETKHSTGVETGEEERGGHKWQMLGARCHPALPCWILLSSRLLGWVLFKQPWTCKPQRYFWPGSCGNIIVQLKCWGWREGGRGITFIINKDVQIRLTSIFSMRLDLTKLMTSLLSPHPSLSVWLVNCCQLFQWFLHGPRGLCCLHHPDWWLTLLIGNIYCPLTLCSHYWLTDSNKTWYWSEITWCSHVMFILINFTSLDPIFWQNFVYLISF